MVNVGDRRILAVDWDDRELRVVHARIRKEKVRVEEVFAVSIPEEVSVGDAVAMGRLLRRALDQEQVSCRRVIVDIPRDQAVLNTLSLPDVSASDTCGTKQWRGTARKAASTAGEAMQPRSFSESTRPACSASRSSATCTG